MYWYLVFDDSYLLPGIEAWEEVEATLPAFQSETEQVLAPWFSRFIGFESVPTFLPKRKYLFMTPLPGVRVYLEAERWMAISTDTLEIEAAVLAWVASLFPA